jgi:hypothetical protein
MSSGVSVAKAQKALGAIAFELLARAGAREL